MAPTHPDTATTADLTRLTRRERQTLDLLAAGYTTRDIAQQLQIRYGTVRIYVHRILRVFRVEDRLQAVIAYLDQIRPADNRGATADPTRLARAERALALVKTALDNPREDAAPASITHTLRDELSRYEHDFGPLDR